MKQITVRKVSDRSVAKAKELARERGVAINDIYVEAVESGLGLRGKPQMNGLQIFAADSNFGEGWENYLSQDLNRVDEEIWR